MCVVSEVWQPAMLTPHSDTHCHVAVRPTRVLPVRAEALVEARTWWPVYPWPSTQQHMHGVMPTQHHATYSHDHHLTPLWKTRRSHPSLMPNSLCRRSHPHPTNNSLWVASTPTSQRTTPSTGQQTRVGRWTLISSSFPSCSSPTLPALPSLLTLYCCIPNKRSYGYLFWLKMVAFMTLFRSIYILNIGNSTMCIFVWTIWWFVFIGVISSKHIY